MATETGGGGLTLDCFKYACPFRVNETSNANRCECTACPNRCAYDLIFVSDHTMSDEKIQKQISESRRMSDPDYRFMLRED